MLFLRQLICAWSIFHLLMNMTDATESDDRNASTDDTIECNDRDVYSCNTLFETNLETICSSGECICIDPEKNRPFPCHLIFESKKNLIGGSCPCKIKYSVCNQGQDACKCITDYRPTKDQKHCVPNIVKLGEPCQEDSQCQEILQPSNVCNLKTKVCSCKDTHMVYKGFCVDREVHEKHSRPVSAGSVIILMHAVIFLIVRIYFLFR